MITNPIELRAKVFALTMDTWTLAATGVLFESGLADQLATPRTAAELTSIMPVARVTRLLDVLVGVGLVVADGDRYRLAEGALPFLAPPMKIALLGDIRSHLMQPLAFLDAPATGGWMHTDPRVLQAQGDSSLAMPGMLKQMVIPALGDLGARLEQPGARVLDVGVGVGMIAVGLCRAFPAVSVVGIDPFDAPLAIAKKNTASLGDRVELRAIGLEALRDEAAFDLAWVPMFFVPPAKADAGLARLHAATKPGGWALCATMNNVPATRLVSDLWGGVVWSGSETEAALTRAGFASARTLPGPAWAPAMVVGQRA